MATGVVAAEVEVETFLGLALRLIRRTGVLFPFGAFQLSQPIANRRSCHEVILAAQLRLASRSGREGVTNSEFLTGRRLPRSRGTGRLRQRSGEWISRRGSNASGGSMAP